MQVVMRGSSEQFEELPEGTRTHYEGLARHRQRQLAAEKKSEVTFLTEQLARHEEHESAARAERGLQHRLSDFRFSEDDWTALVELWNTEVQFLVNPKQVARKLFEALPEPVGERRRQLRVAKPKKPALEEKSALLRLLAENRFFFQGMVMMVEEAGQTIGFRLLFAFKNPLRAFFLPLWIVQSELPLLPADMDLMARAAALRAMSRFEFEWVQGTYITDKGWAADNFKKVWVFQDVQWKGQRACGTNLMPTPLSEFADRLQLIINKISLLISISFACLLENEIFLSIEHFET